MSDDKPNRLEHNWGKYATSLLLVCFGIFHAIKIIHFTKKFLIVFDNCQYISE